MEYNNNEDSASENTENLEEQEETSEENEDAHKENSELEEKNRQLFERAKKAELEAKELRAKIKDAVEPEAPKNAKPNPQSNEPDYAKLAFLNSQQVTHADDQKAVMDEAERLKLPLTEILNMDHVKNRLTANKDARESQEGMPKGKARTGQASKEDVDYYIDRPDELPEDVDLAGKVVEARMNKIEKASKFSSVPFIG